MPLCSALPVVLHHDRGVHAHFDQAQLSVPAFVFQVSAQPGEEEKAPESHQDPVQLLPDASQARCVESQLLLPAPCHCCPSKLFSFLATSRYGTTADGPVYSTNSVEERGGPPPTTADRLRRTGM